MRRRWYIAITAAAVTIGVGGAMTANAATSGGRAVGTSSSTPAVTAAQHRFVGPTVASGAASAAEAPATTSSCTYTANIPADRFKGLPTFNPVTAAKPYIAVLYTTQGVIRIQMLSNVAPCTTNSFRFLAEHGFYNWTHCHRLTTQGIYVLQCGDPTGTGSGGPGYQFPDENLSGATYPAGTVAMANAGPNTNGSQFFFTWKDTTDIAPAYTPFGRVISGMDVLQRIAAAGDDSQNGPGDGYPALYVGINYVQIIPD
jgi:peptidyl-prolyl cis-trans isomerase B (cyclophilin B)